MKKYFIPILMLILVISIGCSAPEVPEEDTTQDEIVQNEIELEEPEEVIEQDPSNGLVTNITMSSECRRDYHVSNLDYKLSRSVDNVSVQIMKLDSKYETIGVYNSMDQSELIYFCDICPVEADMKVPDQADYKLRLKMMEGETVTYSRELSFSTKIGSEFMSQAICSAKEETGCQDSEETRNYKTRGVITFGQEEYIEDCFDTLHTHEFWCEDNEVKKEVIECQNRCWLGRCADIEQE
jgi:hypothetical protein